MAKRTANAPVADAKKSKKDMNAEAAEALRVAEQKKADQRLLAATCTKPNATPEQKAMHEAYKKMGRLSEDKDALLQKFLKDKKCSWHQGLEQVKSESHSGINSGLTGYGTRSNHQLFAVAKLM